MLTVAEFWNFGLRNFEIELVDVLPRMRNVIAIQYRQLSGYRNIC